MALDPVTGMALGGIGQGIFGYLGQREANKTNIKLADQARTHDVNMWDKQNQYNTPEMQMQRLREAGLNPSLVGGQAGQVGQADQPKSAPVPQVQNEMAQMAQMNLVPMLSTYSDMMLKEKQGNVLDIEAEGKLKDNMYKEMTNTMVAHSLPYSKGTLSEKYQILQNQRQGSQADQQILWNKFNQQNNWLQQYGDFQENTLGKSQLNYQQQSTRALQLENAMNEQLKPHLMTSRDQLWQRKLVPIIEKWINDLSPEHKNAPGNILNALNPFGWNMFNKKPKK